ncbi:hypothetical protein [Dinoroseobacter sp. S76]|uniref:hypothetical protein n=1 Tax=Dinoroseobacter sp. S76 TaxID=3415124 RepID=UPI003C7BEAFB
MPTEELFGAYQTPSKTDSFEFRKTEPEDDDPQALEIDLKSVMVTSYSTGGSGADSAGKEEHYYTVTLTEATISETAPDTASDAFLF